ncbi:MAG: hypothetical protein QOD77_656 [Thermoplasmata archaeon]|jgi:hypothetical protein|nr:hypothetical protein [Thermoplasmata archaeon]
MNARSRLLVGVAILAAGAATFWLAASQSEAAVRQVPEILADPAAHTTGSWTMLGVPQPRQIPLTGPNGTYLAPNPAFSDAIAWTQGWTQDGVRLYSTLRLSIEETNGEVAWTLRNETRRSPADPEPALPPTETAWRLGRAGQVFPVEALAGVGETPARVWAWYDAAPEHPLQPKPGQFTGRLLTALPDGTALPPGALVYQVDGYLVGCSSKFLPPGAEERYGDDLVVAD